ncbi:hypothetical protein MBLNU230_g2917t1 [Neophaeotheca triangularis]
MFSSSKPYSAVTVQIDRLTSENYEEDDLSGIVDLIEVIRIQGPGPTEAARALRKKLKYGNTHRQVRALTILNGLIENAGTRFQRAFADEPLLERLRMMARDEAVDPKVRQKCQVLFVYWANQYSKTAGLERIATLYKELPKSQRPAQARNKVLQDTANMDSDNEGPSSPARSRANSRASPVPSSSLALAGNRPDTFTHTSSSMSSSKLSKSSKKSKTRVFNLEKEKDNITKCLANSSMASTNLLNGLQLINREKEQVSQNQEIVRRLETCKALRRQILTYIQLVESDDWIGSLVNANDELVKALTAYEIMDKSLDDDSDSDAWEHLDTDEPGLATTRLAHQQAMSQMKTDDAPPPKPARPNNMSMPPPLPEPAQAEDDDDPFGDSNAAPTPGMERSGMTWKEV